MSNIIYMDEMNPTCPIRNVLSRISSKWGLVVLHTLWTEGAPLRFNVLQKKNVDLSQKMLASTLRTLVEDGLVERRVFGQVPPRVDYSLTERGESLMPHVNALIAWAVDNMEDIMDDRRRSLLGS